MEPGVQTCEETLDAGARLVPRHRLAAGADPAPPRPRGALRLGLPRAAHRRREGARRARRADGRLHRPARLGRGLRPRRRLDRPRSDLRAVRRRRAHPARLHARSGQRRAGDRLHRRVRGRVQLRQPRAPRARGPARHQAVHRGAVGARSTRSATPSTPSSSARDVRLTMGGEPTFVVDRRHGRRRSGTPRRSARPSACSPASCCARLQARFAPGGALHYGQGKWYPGEPLPRWALSCFWRADGDAAVARPRAARRRAQPTRLRHRATRSASSRALAIAARPRARARRARLRGRVLLPVEGGHAAGQRRSAADRSRRSRGTPAPGRRCCAAASAR